MTEPEEKKGNDFTGDRPPPRERSTFGIIVRGCGIAVGIAFLLLLFVVGACFIKM